MLSNLHFFGLRRRNDAYPPWWEEYRQCLKQGYSKNTPLEEVRFVVLDTETTGLSPRKDRILSIAAAGVYAGKLDMRDTLGCFVRQKATNHEAVKVHGILSSVAEQGLPEEEMLKKLLRFCGAGVLVGHHISFDIAMLNAASLRSGGGKLLNPLIDTAHLARQVEFPSAQKNFLTAHEDYNLDALCKRFRIPLQERHTAAGDVYITAVLFLKLLSRLRNQGIRFLGEL